MKKLRFFACLMTLFMGLSFGFTSCGDKDDDSSTNDSVVSGENEAINKGKQFYADLELAVKDKDTAAGLRVASVGLEYSKFKEDKAWTTNFLAGVVMAKYGVSDANVAKSEKYMKEVADLKAILDGGINVENISSALLSLATFVTTK